MNDQRSTPPTGSEAPSSFAQALATLSHFTSSAAHELRNPLHTLVLHLALLRKKLESGSGDPKPHLDVLDQEITRFTQMLEGFLEFTRVEEIQAEPIALDPLLREVAAAIATRAKHQGIRTEWIMKSALPDVLGSAALLRKAFFNLVTNACDAMPDGGVLQVSAEPSSERSVLISVADTGRGIPAEDLPRVFDLFYTTKPLANGIGLSLAYRIVQLHGGEIRIDSEIGKGSQVIVSLSKPRQKS